MLLILGPKKKDLKNPKKIVLTLWINSFKLDQDYTTFAIHYQNTITAQ